MAILVNDLNKEKEKQDQQQSGNPIQIGAEGSSNQLSGGSTPMTMAVSAAPASAPPAASTPSSKGTSSGRFVNIQNYLNANKNSNLGQKVASNIKQTGQQVNQNLQQQKQEFEQKSDQGRLKQEQSMQTVNNAINNAGQYVYNNQAANTPSGAQTFAPVPTTPTVNEQAVKDFQKITEGKYSGPQDLANSANLQARAQEAQTLGNLTGNEQGRFTLLKRMFSTPTYTRGQTNLDQLILGGNKNQMKELRDARQATAAMPTVVNNEVNNVRNLVGQYTNEAKTVGEQAKTALNTAQTAAEKALDEKLKTTQETELKNRQAYQELEDNLKQGYITKEQADRLGLKANGNQLDLYGVNPLDFLKTQISNSEINRNTVASKDEALRLNALARLAGMSNDELDYNKAGEFKASTQDIDSKLYDQMASGKAQKESLEKQRQDAINRYNTQKNLFNEIQNMVGKANQSYWDATHRTEQPNQEMANSNLSASLSTLADKIKAFQQSGFYDDTASYLQNNKDRDPYQNQLRAVQSAKDRSPEAIAQALMQYATQYNNNNPMDSLLTGLSDVGFGFQRENDLLNTRGAIGSVGTKNKVVDNTNQQISKLLNKLIIK